MRAAIFHRFQGPISIEDVPDPGPDEHAAVIELKACGICRSDWHAWMGHDTDVQLPHVPGHELSGVIAAVGNSVRHFRVGQRVTVPFCCGCGTCSRQLSPDRLVSNRVGLEHGAQLLTEFDKFPNSGMTIIDFSI